ncbi:hypothetical protein J1614_010981 [Plenodomus biglobosus]|nr:hypothetical protein J1614_010981 [Plenodomus biglobosus]
MAAIMNIYDASGSTPHSRPAWYYKSTSSCCEAADVSCAVSGLDWPLRTSVNTNSTRYRVFSKAASNPDGPHVAKIVFQALHPTSELLLLKVDWDPRLGYWIITGNIVELHTFIRTPIGKEHLH